MRLTPRDSQRRYGRGTQRPQAALPDFRNEAPMKSLLPSPPPPLPADCSPLPALAAGERRWLQHAHLPERAGLQPAEEDVRHRAVRRDRRQVAHDLRLRSGAGGRYQEALATLDLLQNPNTAEALNYRGYATRKLGRVDEGIGYYLQSVALDPDYTLVREYLGEAYVIKGDLPLAKVQLAEIEKRCGTTCEPYQDLAEAIADAI